MNSLLKFDDNLQSIKSARLYCHVIAVSLIILSFLSWSLSPYLLQGKKNSVIFGRYITLIFSGLSGISILFSANYLKKTNYIIIASEKASENTLINQLASSQYASQQYYQEIAKQLPLLIANQEINNSLQISPNTDNSTDITLMPELSDDLIPIFNLACEQGQLSIRELCRHSIGTEQNLNSDLALDKFQKLEKLNYGHIEKKGLSIRFIPNIPNMD